MFKENGCLLMKVLGVATMTSTLLSLLGCGNSDSSTGTTPPPVSPVSVRVNQTIPNHSHTIDYYIPNNATVAVVFLHGGGGRKEGLEYSLGIKADSTTTNYDLSSSGQAGLINEQVMAVFPQGQAVAGANWTWSNYVMDSGVDDVQFLQDLVSSPALLFRMSPGSTSSATRMEA